MHNTFLHEVLSQNTSKLQDAKMAIHTEQQNYYSRMVMYIHTAKSIFFLKKKKWEGDATTWYVEINKYYYIMKV